jgi:uncharacterized delta-60 repeat protein
MATITYKCNICERNIDLLENPIGLTTFSKCVITYGCKGKMLSVKRNQDNIRETFPVEVPGLIDYSPRNVLSNFNQVIPLTTWVITHNLNTIPVVTVFVDNTTGTQTELNPTQFTVIPINSNQLKVVFTTAYSGSIQLISRNSIKVNPTIAAAPTILTQVTSNGNFVFAVPKYLTKFSYPPTVLPAPGLPYDLASTKLRIEVSIQKPNEETIVCTEFLSTDLSGTPWNSWNSILVRKRKNYYLFAINILNFRTFGGNTTQFNDIPDGTRLQITRVDYGTGVLQPVDTEGLFIMLSNSPYTINDKIKDSIVDVGDMVDNNINYFTYNTSDFFVDPSNVDRTYPDISKVNPVIPVIAPLPSITPTITPSITITPSVTLTPQVTPTPTPSPIPYNLPPYLAELNSDGTPDTHFIDKQLDSHMYVSYETSDGHIYFGGDTSTSIPGNYSYLGRLNSDGSIDTTFTNYNLDYDVETIYQTADGHIYIGGNFSTFNGISVRGFVRLNSDGSFDSTFAGGCDGDVITICQTLDGHIYVGGAFNTICGASYNGIARLSATGVIDSTFIAPVSSSISVNCIIQTIDTNIYVCNASNPTTYTNFCRLTSAGILDTSFTDLTIDNIVKVAYQTSDGSIYIGGSFNNVGGYSYPKLAKLNSDGTINNAFALSKPQVISNIEIFGVISTTYVYAIMQAIDSKIYIGSDNVYINGNSYTYFSRLNSDGSFDNTFNSLNLTGSVYNINKISSGDIYISGAFN